MDDYVHMATDNIKYKKAKSNLFLEKVHALLN